MGGCQNYGPFLGTLNNRCRGIIGTQKGTIILTTTHMTPRLNLEPTCAKWSFPLPHNHGPTGIRLKTVESSVRSPEKNFRQQSGCNQSKTPRIRKA